MVAQKERTFRKDFASQPKCGLNVLSWSLAPLFKKRRDINVRASGKRAGLN